MAAVLALDGLTKKHFGHYAILKLFSLRSPGKQACEQALSGDGRGKERGGLCNSVIMNIGEIKNK